MIRMCLCATALIASVALSVSSSYATTVKLSGTIKDSITQKGIASAVVHLALHPWITATTDTGGNYSLSGSTPIEYSAGGLVSAQISFSQNRIFYPVMKNGDRVKIELFDISGRLIGVPVDRQLNAGEYNISLADLGLANQVYIARITSGGRTAQLRVAFVNDGRSGYIGGTGFSKRNGNLAKISAVVDTEIVTAKGYIIARKTITSFSGTGNLTLLPSAGALLNAIPDLKKLLPKSLNNGVHSATVAAAVGDSTVIVPADEPDVLSAGYYELKDAISNNSFNNLSILLKLGMAGKPVVPDSDMALGSVRIPTGMKVLDMYDTVQDLGHVIISQLSVDTCEYRWYSLQRSKQSASDTGTPASILCYLRFIGNDTASMKVEGTFKIDLGGGSIMDHAISYDATTGKIVEITVPGSCDLATQVGTVDGIRQQIISKGSLKPSELRAG